MEEGAKKKNIVAKHFEKGEKMENVNGDKSIVSFLNQGITEYN